MSATTTATTSPELSAYLAARAAYLAGGDFSGVGYPHDAYAPARAAYNRLSDEDRDRLDRIALPPIPERY